MLNSDDLYNSIKLDAMKAVEASQPCDFLYGKVTSVSPLKISVEQKLTLGSAQLVLSRNVTDHTVDVTVDWKTETKGEGSTDSHTHPISGTKKMTIHNGLKIGDEVILIKKKGGQKYLVFDRMVKT